MTQILLYRCEEGIVLATDSRAVAFEGDQEGPRRVMEVQKLFHLTPDLLMVTAGAGYGILLCRQFQAHARRTGLYEFQEISASALDLFPSWVEDYRKKNECSESSRDLDRLYIILTGHEPERAEGALPFLMLAAESSTDPLHPVQMPDIITIPRQMTLEYRLARLSPPENSLEKVEALFEKFMHKRADFDDEIGPPFYFIRITPTEGLKIRAWKG